MPDHATLWGLVSLTDDFGATTRVAPSGELDLATASHLDGALRAAQRSTVSVTLDLRRLSFMDCSSLAVLIAAADRADDSGGRFRIVRGPPIIDRLFALTGIDHRLEISQPLPPANARD